MSDVFIINIKHGKGNGPRSVHGTSVGQAIGRLFAWHSLKEEDADKTANSIRESMLKHRVNSLRWAPPLSMTEGTSLAFEILVTVAPRDFELSFDMTVSREDLLAALEAEEKV